MPFPHDRRPQNIRSVQVSKRKHSVRELLLLVASLRRELQHLRTDRGASVCRMPRLKIWPLGL